MPAIVYARTAHAGGAGNVFCENAPGNRAAADEIVSQQRTNRHRFGVFVFGSSGGDGESGRDHGKDKTHRMPAEIAPLLRSGNLSPIVVEDRAVISYTLRLIKRIRHKGLERFFATGDTRGIDGKQATWLRILLTALHAAAAPAELNQPDFGFIP